MDELKPWDRQPGERNLWYDRFTRYREAGPGRSVLAIVNAERATKGHKKSWYTPGAWHQAAVKYKWKERAEAWDEAERRRRSTEVERAREILLDGTPTAATKLVALLGDDDSSVARRAANDVLNRVGLPTVSRNEHTGENGGPILYRPDLSGMNDAELDQYIANLEAAVRAGARRATGTPEPGPQPATMDDPLPADAGAGTPI